MRRSGIDALTATGVDPLWFGIVVILGMGQELIHPLIGTNALTVKSAVRDFPLGKTFRGGVPFRFADLVALLLLFLFHSLATGLPRFMS